MKRHVRQQLSLEMTKQHTGRGSLPQRSKPDKRLEQLNKARSRFVDAF